MKPVRRRALISMLGMVGAAAAAHVATPTRKLADGRPTDLKAMFPERFSSWRIDDTVPVILPAPDIQAKLDQIYNQVLSRTYIDASSGQRVMLAVAYGGDQSDGTKAHLPEVCYPAQGFQMLRSARDSLTLNGRIVPVKRMVAQLGGRVEPVTYWLTIGDDVAATITDRKLAQMRYGLRGLIPDGMLIRVSTIDRDVARSYAVQNGFLQAMAAGVPPQLADRVLGRLDRSDR